jgi:hypothetical protein
MIHSRLRPECRDTPWDGPTKRSPPASQAVAEESAMRLVDDEDMDIEDDFDLDT